MTSRIGIAATAKRPLLPRSQILTLILPLLHPSPSFPTYHRHQSVHTAHHPHPRLPTTPIHITTRNMASDEQIPEIILRTRAAVSGIPGEQVEPRQILQDSDSTLDPSKHKAPAWSTGLLDDQLALYSCQPTVERVCRYAPGELSSPTLALC